MSNVTPAMVKELRERTGLGMSKCKKALDESSGNMEQAIDFLRKAGIASAVKKGGREANEGMIGFKESANAICIAEVNSETDFVAQNERFKAFVDTICETVLDKSIDNVETLLQEKTNGNTFDEARAELIQTLGENIVIKRFSLLKKKENASYAVYSHMGGKIVTCVEISGASDRQALCKDIAMHVAAESPDYLNSSKIPEDVKKREEEIAREQVKGKPENIMDKIIHGKMNAFYDSVCLVGQKYIKDSSMTVEQFVKSQSKDLEITHFIRMQLGE